MGMRIKELAGVTLIATGLVACGGSSGGSTGNVSMANLPSPTELLSSGSAAQTGMSFASVTDAVSVHDLMAAVTDSNASTALTNLDTYFGGGILANITADNDGLNNTQRDNFWKFQNKCFVTQSLVQGYTELEGAATSGCYVQGMARLADTDLIASGSASSVAEALRQDSSDKLVKVQVTNNPNADDGDGNMGVFITVKGADSVDAGVYQLEFNFCRNGASDGKETLSFNVNTGAYTSTSGQNHGDGSFLGSLTATAVEQADGNYAFVGDRSFSGNGSGDWGKFATRIDISGTQLTVRQRFENGSGANAFSGKNYVIANILGSSFRADATSPVKILEAGFAGYNSGQWGSNSNYGAFEYNASANPKYSDVTTGDLYTTAQAFSTNNNFSSEDFFSSTLSAPTIDTSFDCTQTPDVVVNMDFSKPSIAALGEKCERSFRDSRVCDGNNLNSIRTKVFAP